MVIILQGEIMNDILHILNVSYDYYGLLLSIIFLLVIIFPVFMSLRILIKDKTDEMMIFGIQGTISLLFIFLFILFSRIYYKKDEIDVLLNPKYINCTKEFPYLKAHLIRFDYKKTFDSCKNEIDNIKERNN